MFGFYDIRGIWGEEIDPWKAEKLGGAIRDKLGGDVMVAVGRDVRISSLPLSFHLELGMGGEIIELGITTTPMAYYYAWKEKTETFQVTASHNPPEYNGVKPVHPDGMDWDPSEIRELERLYTDAVPKRSFKAVVDRSRIDEYLELYASWDVPRVSLLFDPSNGAAYQLVPILQEKFNLKVVNGLPDGRFPNHPPDPLKPESRKDLLRLSREWGVLTDGDGDRLALAYKNILLGTDEIVAFLAERGIVKGSVALEVTVPLALEEYLQDLGIKVERTPTGRVLIKQMAIQKRFEFFAEYSGHFGFKEFNYIDDPLYTFFKVLEAGNGEFSTEYRPPFKSDVVSFRLTREQVSEIVSSLDPDEVKTLDGFDVRMELGRVLIRESKTEKGKWRIYWESADEESFRKLSSKMEVILRGVAKDSG